MRGSNRTTPDSISSWPKTVAHSDGEGGSRWFKYLRAYSMAVSSVCWADLDDYAVWGRKLRAVGGPAPPTLRLCGHKNLKRKTFRKGRIISRY